MDDRVVLRRARSVTVETANAKVPITVACQVIGMDLPDYAGYQRPLKVHCPFGEFYHVDGGLDPAMRIYPDSNSAYCFAGCGYFSPVWLVAQACDVSTYDAAVSLLERVGHRPASPAQRWAQASTWESPPDVRLLSEALKTYCARICSHWSDQQFDPSVATTLTRCLALLDRVGTESEAQEWLHGVKIVMQRALDVRKTSVRD